MPIEPTNEPLDADSEEDTVIIEGGAGCVMSMTPQAALDSADRINGAAAEAIGKGMMKRQRERRLA